MVRERQVDRLTAKEREYRVGVPKNAAGVEDARLERGHF